MKKLYQALFVACLYTVSTNIFTTGIDLSLDKADPNPMNCTEMPITYIYSTAKTALRKGQYNSGAGVQVTALPFHVHATKGTNMDGIKDAELGDLSGRANLFTMFNSNLPSNYAAGSAIPTLLGTAPYLDANPTAATSPVNNDGTLPQQLLLDLQAATYTLSGVTGVVTGTDTGLIYGGTAFTGSGTSGTGNVTSAPTPTQFTTIAGLRSLQDNLQLIGFLTGPAKYSKYGSRFEIVGASSLGIGAAIRIGVSSISQSGFFNNEILFGNVDVTSYPTGSTGATTPTTTTVPNAAYYLKNDVKVLVNNPFYNDPITGKVTDSQWYEALKVIKQDTANQLDLIAKTTGLDLSDFQKTGVEDLRLELFWRKGLKLDTDQPVVFIPYVSLVGSLDVTAPVKPNQILAAPFGNNGHKSYGGNAGFTLDFDNSFEVGAAVGLVAFTSRYEPNLRVPTDVDQSVLYPYATAASISPGNNWFMSLLINSYHFEENLTFYMQYIYVGHGRDKIKLTSLNETITPSGIYTQTYFPEVLESKSPWSSQMVNLGLNYEVSPSITIGCGGQIPIKQMNAYRSATFALSIFATH